MRYCRKIFVLACVLFAAGCGSITTKYPIGITTGLQPDKALYGTWKGHFVDQDNDLYLHFLKADSGELIAIWVFAPTDDEHKGGAMIFKIITAKLGDNRYINAVELTPDKKVKAEPRGYTPALYRFESDGQLTICKIDKDKLVKAIESGALAGVIEEHGARNSIQHYEDIIITSKPEQLDAYMAKPEASDLFVSCTTSKRAE
jgi:hypothetical protein